MLTDTEIKKLKAVGKEYQKADGKGLSLVVRAGGEKLWRYEFRLDSKKKKYSYGNYPELSAKDARAIHGIATKLVELGESPAKVLDDAEGKRMAINGAGLPEIEARIKAKNEADKSITFGELAGMYKLEIDRTWKNPAKAWGPINKHLLPRLGNRSLNEIDVPVIRELIYDIREKVGTPSARHVRDWANRIFSYGVEHSYCQHNPAMLVRSARIGKFVPRERWLKSQEIRVYLTELYRLNIYRGHKLGLHLLLMLGLRINELVGVEWSDIDFDNKELLIPGHRMKGKNDHRVLLPKQAIDMLKELKILACDSPYVFPSDRNPQKTIQAATLRYNHQQVCESAGIEDYKPHDHRHTASTHLRERGHSPEVVEIALSHAIPGVAGIYAHVEYKAKRREMLQDWADFIDTLMTERVVIEANFKRAESN